MSDFVAKPLLKRMNLQNFATRVEHLEDQTAAQPSAFVQTLDEISVDTGTLSADMLLTPADDVTSTVPTDSDFSGGFMAAEPQTFGSDSYTLGGVNLGVLQFGLSATNGKAYAGAGSVVLDENGIILVSGTTAPSKIKWYSALGGTLHFSIANFNDGTTVETLYKMESVAGRNSLQRFIAEAPTTKSAEILLQATSNITDVIIDISAIDTGGSLININSNQVDADTSIFGTSATAVLKVDAGLNVVGINVVPETGIDLKVNGAIKVGGGASIAQLSTGTYTPTLTNTTNIAASTAYVCQWMRVGDMVTVSGRVDIDPTAAGSISLGMSIPVASNFTASNQLGGVAAATAIHQSLGIISDATNDRAAFGGTVTDTANRSYNFSFMYQIL